MHIGASSAARRHWRPRSALLVAGLSLAVLSGASGGVLAHEGHGHPARIHEGTCEDLGRVDFRLNGVGANVDLDNAPLATPTAVNPDGAHQVMLSETMIDGTLDGLLAAPHAVMVYESDDQMDAISCGNLGGALLDGSLVVGLAEAGVPGHLGFAVFEPDGEQTAVSIILGHALAPVSASGAASGHEHAPGEDHDDANQADDHAEEAANDASATPEA